MGEENNALGVKANIGAGSDFSVCTGIGADGEIGSFGRGWFVGEIDSHNNS